MKSRALSAVTQALEAQGIGYALIGATALPVYGAVRSTVDADLLVFDRAILQDSTWAPVRQQRVSYEIRIADDQDDPIVGVVRVAPRSRLPVDVVMPRGSWLPDVIARAGAEGPRAVVAGVEVPVVLLSDLLLLKVEAGGFDDVRDVRRLLDANPERRAELVAKVEQTLPSLSREARGTWARIRDELDEP